MGGLFYLMTLMHSVAAPQASPVHIPVLPVSPTMPTFNSCTECVGSLRA